MTASPSKLSPWELQAQLWKRELTPTTPLLFHHEYSDTDDKKKSSADIAAALSGISAPEVSDNSLYHHHQVTTTNTTAAGEGDNNNNNNETQQPDDVAAAAAADISTAHEQEQQQLLGNHAAMRIEAGAVIDEMSPDRGSFKSIRRRAQALRADQYKRAAATAAAAAAAANSSSNNNASSSSSSPATPVKLTLGGTSPKVSAAASASAMMMLSPSCMHGLECVKSPYRLHAIVSQKDAHKRRRVDEHATSTSMLGHGRISHRMSDTDVAAYHPNSKISQKLDKEPDALLADTVIAARGGLTPQERLNKQVNRFVETLCNAAEREEENQILPPTTPNNKSSSSMMAASNNTSTSTSGVTTTPLATTPNRRPGFAQRLLQEQEHHIVDAMASIILSKANPPTVEELQRSTVATAQDALSFALSADDKHILLTTLKFATGDELYPTPAEFSRVIGFSKNQGKHLLQSLASSFDHWNRLCYNKGHEWALLKRCLAAVTETPVSWSSRMHTARSVHFGNVSQRDMEGLLSRLRNDERNKSEHVVVEKHKNKLTV